MRAQLTQLAFRCLLVAAISVAAETESTNGPANSLSPDEAKAGWKLLFDGATTAGWAAHGGGAFPDQLWRVEDGCLRTPEHANRHGVKRGDIITTEKFDDFDFKFDWRISRAGNSGVKYLVIDGRKGTDGLGCEYQILDDDANADAAVGPKHQAAALYDLIPANTNKHLAPVGQWNHSEIILRGNHGEHWLNGKLVVQFDLGSPELTALVASSKYKDKAGFAVKHSTVLLLQDHGDAVWFRNLKVRRLGPGQ